MKHTDVQKHGEIWAEARGNAWAVLFFSEEAGLGWTILNKWEQPRTNSVKVIAMEVSPVLELALGLCALVFILFICLIASHFLRRARMKVFIGITMSLTAALAMVLFCYIQRVNGNPDQGMELLQWYLPLTAFIFFIAAGIIAATSVIKGKSKREAGGNYESS